MASQTAGNNSRHGLIAVAHKYLFAVKNELNMGAELRFQIADIDSSHAAIIADVTMLVICIIVGNARQREHASTVAGRTSVNSDRTQRGPWRLSPDVTAFACRVVLGIYAQVICLKTKILVGFVSQIRETRTF
jgi:hypothetical protein